MYRIANIIDGYYKVNGINKISNDELKKLTIKENVYITINDDNTYYIVNKEKDMVYISKYKKVWEEDNDY
jgi:hypothetical protein